VGINISVEAAMRELLAAQHGVISTRQCRAAGLSRKAERHRVETGRLVPRHRGVYADTASPGTWHQRVMAGVLVAGVTAFASHATAAQLLGLLAVDESAPIEVTTILERAVRVPGLRAHRSGLLEEQDMHVVDGIPTSTASRLISDMSGRMGVVGLGRMADDAVRRGLTSYGAIAACLDRLPQAPGRSPHTVRDMLATRFPEFGARESWLEEFVFDALRRYDLPLPRTQVEVTLPTGRRRLDKCYVDEKLVLESDGFDPHSRRRVFDDDRKRNNDLLLAGYRVLHFTSEFTDYQIACTVAAALGVSVPKPAPGGPQSFKQWCGAQRVGLCSGRGSGGRRGR
jgi:very-short-patch-repair endonuclease